MPPAARVGDMHVCPMVDPGPKPHVGGPVLPAGCPTVLIGFMPAARVMDTCTCVGPPDAIARGSPTVLIGNMMAARIGDQTVHGGTITVGCPTVIIGEVGGGPIAVPSLGVPGAPSTTCRGKPLRQQEQPMSCLQASTSMAIRDMSGQEVSEARLRAESFARGSPPGYHPINGTMISDATTMLSDHGVPNNGWQANANAAAIQNATSGGNPVIMFLGNPGHAVIADGVRNNPDGTQSVLLRDPGLPGAAGCREMVVGGTEWNNRVGPTGTWILSFPPKSK